MKAFLDTHAAVALWRGDVDVFGTASTILLENAFLLTSPVVVLELAFLREIGRLSVSPGEIIDALAWNAESRWQRIQFMPSSSSP